MADFSDRRPLDQASVPGVEGCYMCPLCTRTGGHMYPIWECRHPDAPEGIEADSCYMDMQTKETNPRMNMPEECPLRYGVFPIRAAVHLRLYGGGPYPSFDLQEADEPSPEHADQPDPEDLSAYKRSDRMLLYGELLALPDGAVVWAMYHKFGQPGYRIDCAARIKRVDEVSWQLHSEGWVDDFTQWDGARDNQIETFDDCGGAGEMHLWHAVKA